MPKYKVKRAQKIAKKIIKFVNPTSAKAIAARKKKMAKVHKELSKKRKK